jgi:hypothetical protein
MVVVFTMLFALAMMAQTATQTAPAAPATGDNAQACGCCDHDKCPMMKDGKMADGMSCCGKDGGCKDGKCDMKAHKDGKMACCSGDKCAMKDGKMASGKGCCGKDGGCCKTTASTSCCAKGAACCKNGTMPCCGQDKVAA